MSKIEENKSLLPYNTFGIQAVAKHFVSVTSLNDARQIPTYLRTYTKYHLLGGGSNVLFTSDYDGLMIRMAMKGVEVLEESESHCLVKAAAGEDWPAFVDFCVSKNWGGIENLALIPGQVGASPVQNIGAYGREAKDVIHLVEAISLSDGSIRTFTNAQCQFGYRDSIFKNVLKDQYLITSVTFRLHKTPELYLDYGAIREELKNTASITFRDVAEAVTKIRRSKLPDSDEVGSAGSFFKNPVVEKSRFDALQKAYASIPFYVVDEGYKIPAGWLIDQCGWKGFRQGNYGIYPHQALVLVNYGGASGKEIFQLSEKIRRDVKNKFGIILHREVTVV